MSALIVTLGAAITSLRRAMAGATQLVADSAKKMASMSVVGLKVGLGAALAGGASAVAGGDQGGHFAAKTGWPSERVLFMPPARLTQCQHCLLRAMACGPTWSGDQEVSICLREQLKVIRA